LGGDELGGYRFAVSGDYRARSHPEELGDCGGPIKREGVGEVRISTLLDEISGEKHTRVRRPHRDVMVGVSPAGMGQQHSPTAEVELDITSD
jgi:hypothetical protein